MKYQSNEVRFLENWPFPPKGKLQQSDIQEQCGASGGRLTTFKRGQIQMLLAINPYGIPSLKLCEEFKKVFKKPLDIEDLGYSNLADFIQQKDIFTIQSPDEVTAVLFPNSKEDFVLHDARLNREFIETNQQIAEPISHTYQNARAKMSRDCEFPPDVCLSGEAFKDFIFPAVEGRIPDSKGSIHKAMIVSVGDPNNIFMNVKGKELEALENLTQEVTEYFQNSSYTIEAYAIPQEFIYFGFPCLSYNELNKTWERSMIVGLSKEYKYKVESVDYGGRRNVPHHFLRLIPKKFVGISKQAVLVSMMGVVPLNQKNKWNPSAGERIRSFSNYKYWLDCVFVENKNRIDWNAVESESDEMMKKLRKRADRIPKYEVLMCDRNDEDLDIHLDKILVIETYAAQDEDKAGDINILRNSFMKQLANIDRPTYSESLILYDADRPIDEKESDTGTSES